MATQTYSFKDEVVQAALEQKLRTLSRAREVAEQHCLYRLDFDLPGKKKVVVKQYRTGTVVLSGDEHAPLFKKLVHIIAGADALPEAGAVPDAPWAGVDEAGKGDYFGPLTVAAFFADGTILKSLREMGVRDSKRLADERVIDLAGRLESRLGRSCAVVELLPDRYNTLIARFKEEHKNLNDLLAWAVSKAIKKLRRKNVFGRVIVDRFAKEFHLERRLAGEEALNVIQIPRGEADPAVAAASIIARARFLQRLDKLEQQFGTRLPKGASERTVEAARKFVELYGRGALKTVAKLHFKTTDSL